MPLTGASGSYSLGEANPILTGLAKARNHDGGRIALGPDGMLSATVGDAGQPDRAQDPSSLNGKILRMTPTGALPRANPDTGSMVHSLGHRNPKGSPGTRMGSSGPRSSARIPATSSTGSSRAATTAGPSRRELDRKRFYRSHLQQPTSDASPSGRAFVGGAFFLAVLRGERLWAIAPGSSTAMALCPSCPACSGGCGMPCRARAAHSGYSPTTPTGTDHPATGTTNSSKCDWMSPARVNLEVMITGYDPETLRERVDRAAVESRLAEIGNGRSTTALGEKAELLRLLGRHGEALVAAEQAFRLAHFSGDREQLTAARLRRARVFQYQGELDRALAEMTAVRASAALEEWASLEGSAAYSSGCALFDLGRFRESREAFTAALDIRTGSEAPAAEIDAARFALEAATHQEAADG